MFQTTVSEIITVPGLEYLHITGINTKGSISVGEFITDGEFKYEITAIPIERRAGNIKFPDEVNICIDINDNFDKDRFVGKTLYAV